MSEINITATRVGNGSKILVDGEEVRHLRKAVLTLEVGQLTKLELEHTAVRGDVTGLADVSYQVAAHRRSWWSRWWDRLNSKPKDWQPPPGPPWRVPEPDENKDV